MLKYALCELVGSHLFLACAKSAGHRPEGGVRLMNQYELGVIISARLDEENQKTELDRVQALIERFGGTIEKMDSWGRRKLAYPIQKQTDGVYTFITFSSEPGAPAEIENRLRIVESVLRFLVIRLDD